MNQSPFKKNSKIKNNNKNFKGISDKKYRNSDAKKVDLIKVKQKDKSIKKMNGKK